MVELKLGMPLGGLKLAIMLEDRLLASRLTVKL
jgi:hypothetical protein